ncbi:MAG: arylsulfatase, partial [Acidimicrobiales bacterium]
NGLKYSNMHTTALCSPTRSCILTGRNHHSNHVACIMEMATGYPGYDSNIPFENGFMGEMLIPEGYNSYAIGKWHLTPAEQVGAACPYDRWPTGRGFERYYGFLGGDTNQWYPALVHDQHQVDPPKTPEEGYHLTPDLIDRAIGMIADGKQVATAKPFFMYLAVGAGHAPHHVPKEWADKYRGKFDDGWSKYREKVLANQKKLGIIPDDAELSRHDPDVQDWDSLSDDERRLYARMMEVFAGFVSHADHHVGRLIDFLESIDQLDNTLLIAISDNGASPEGTPIGSLNENRIFNNVGEKLSDNLEALDDLGGPKYYNHYAWGWAWAGDTPFRRWKRETYRGGVTDPCLVHWPAGIKARGEVRHQWAHAIDLVPTVLDALGLEQPSELRGVTQSPVEGFSFAHTFDDADADTKHKTQYFEMIGHRSIYHDGWRAVCPYPGPSFKEGAEKGYLFPSDIDADKLAALDRDGWELYHTDADVAENHNVADEHPDRLRDMITLWYTEAGKYNVFPIDGPNLARFGTEHPEIDADRQRYVYWPGTQGVPEHAAVHVLNRSHVVAATVDISDDGVEGVLLAHGGDSGGYSLFVKDGNLHYTHNYVAAEQFHVESTKPVPTGRSLLSVQVETTGDPDVPNGKGAPATATLFINDEAVGSVDMPHTIPTSISVDESLTCGRDAASPVSELYTAPFDFTGTLEQVTVDVTGDKIQDHEAEIHKAFARQ